MYKLKVENIDYRHVLRKEEVVHLIFIHCNTITS